MDVTALFIRALDTSGAVYLPYDLKGDFTEEEKTAIENAFSPHVLERVDATFNNWRVTKVSDNYFMARRATWDNVWGTKTALEMAEKITAYYERLKDEATSTKLD